MPLTPADVHNVAFSKSPIGKRGYNEDEVDAFLDLVGAELARFMGENKDLHNRVIQLDQQLRAAQVDTVRNRRPVEPSRPVMATLRPPMSEQSSPSPDQSGQAAKVLGLAQQIADRLTDEARAEANGTLNRARTASAQLLSEARVKADGMVNEARIRAETMVNDANTRADALYRQSREKAVSLEREAARKHGEVIGSISQEKTILEKKIDELRTFEREYRAHLTTYLATQLRELDRRGSAAPADTINTQQGFVTSGFGAHAESGNDRSDPKMGNVDAVRSSNRNGPSHRGFSDEPDRSGIRWKPAVELDGVGVRDVIEPWAPAHRSVSRQQAAGQ